MISEETIHCSILHCLDGAKNATGLTVIIDVFRAFSVECYLYEMGARLVRPVGTIEEARSLHEKIPDSILIGERKGIRCEGFDFGNSPSSLLRDKVEGKVAIHTTSAGTQGIVNATKASEIITGSLVNARAISDYILRRRKEEAQKGNDLKVSLVAMGLSGERPAEEDEFCAEYIRSLVTEGKAPEDFEARKSDLRNFDGRRFFDPALQKDFPEKDYWMCIDHDRFPFVLSVKKDQWGYYSEKIMSPAQIPAIPRS